MENTRRDFLLSVAAGSPALGAGWTTGAPIEDLATSILVELRLDFVDLTDTEVLTVTVNSYRLDRATQSEITGKARRIRFPIPKGNSRTGANEIRIEWISEKVKLAGQKCGLGEWKHEASMISLVALFLPTDRSSLGVERW